jgi:hypothetical protein
MFRLHETAAEVPPFLSPFWFIFHGCIKGHDVPSTRKAAPPAGAKADGPKPDSPKSDVPKSPAPARASPAPNPPPMKVFFGATALALVISICTGLFNVVKICSTQSRGGRECSSGHLCPRARASLFVRDPSGSPIFKRKSVATDRRRAKWNCIYLFLLFRFFGILGSFENSNDCPKI